MARAARSRIRQGARALAAAVFALVALAGIALALAPRFATERFVTEAARRELRVTVARARVTTSGVRFEGVRGRFEAASEVTFSLDAVDARFRRAGGWELRGDGLAVTVACELDALLEALDGYRARRSRATDEVAMSLSVRDAALHWSGPCGAESEITLAAMSVDASRRKGQAARTSVGAEARIACGVMTWGPGRLSLSAEPQGDTLTLTSRGGERALVMSRDGSGALNARVVLRDLAMPPVPPSLRASGIGWPAAARWSLEGEITRTRLSPAAAPTSLTGAFDARASAITVDGVAAPAESSCRFDLSREGDGPMGLRGRLRHGPFAASVTAQLTLASDGRVTGPVQVRSEPLPCATLADIAARRQGAAGTLGAHMARTLGLDRHIRGAAVLELDAKWDSEAPLPAPALRVRGDCGLSLFR